MHKRKKLILILLALLAVIIILILILMALFGFSCSNLELNCKCARDPDIVATITITATATTTTTTTTTVVNTTTLTDNGKGWVLPKQVSGNLVGALGTVHEPEIPAYYGPYSLDILLVNVPAGYSLFSGHWGGWCVDSNITFQEPLTTFTANVYSSLNLSNVPAYAKDDEQWDKINYILNHKGDAAPWDIQLAIWYFSDAVFNSYYVKTAGALAIIADASANGTGFVPGPGQLGAVILDCGPQSQLFFIELDP